MNSSLPTACAVDFAAAAATALPGLPGVAIVACSGGALLERSADGAWTRVLLRAHGGAPLPENLTALAAWPSGAGVGSIELALGGRPRGVWAPALWSASCRLGAGGEPSCNLTLARAPLNASSTAVRRMRVSSLVVAPRSATVVAALSAADYYDGYLPPGLLVSTDGARSFGFERRLSNHNVVSLAVDARGRVCAATNGNGHQCVQIGRRQ